MKNGVYYSEQFNDLLLFEKASDQSLVLSAHIDSPAYGFKFIGLCEIFIQTNYEFICEFWDESAELERYKKALDEAAQALNYYKETRDEKLFPFGVSSNFKSKDRAEIALEKINQILNGGGE